MCTLHRFDSVDGVLRVLEESGATPRPGGRQAGRNRLRSRLQPYAIKTEPLGDRQMRSLAWEIKYGLFEDSFVE